MKQTRTDFWHTRGRELHRLTKHELCHLYRQLGGLGGVQPPEKWLKEEVVTAVAGIEWERLPNDVKQPREPLLSPPCDVCGKGEASAAHHVGGSHNYRYTHDPAAEWVPYYDPCHRCGWTHEQHDAWTTDHYYQRPPETEEQPPAADATVSVDRPTGAPLTLRKAD